MIPLDKSSILSLFAKVVLPELEGPATQINFTFSIFFSISEPIWVNCLLCLASQILANVMSPYSLIDSFTFAIELAPINLPHLYDSLSVLPNTGESINGGILPSFSLLGYWRIKPDEYGNNF